MTIRSDCADAGHCYHEPDGACHQRHRNRPLNDRVNVHCCWCNAKRSLPVHANCAQGTVIVSMAHGAYVEAA